MIREPRRVSQATGKILRDLRARNERIRAEDRYLNAGIHADVRPGEIIDYSHVPLTISEQARPFILREAV